MYIHIQIYFLYDTIGHNKFKYFNRFVLLCLFMGIFIHTGIMDPLFSKPSYFWISNSKHKLISSITTTFIIFSIQLTSLVLLTTLKILISKQISIYRYFCRLYQHISLSVPNLLIIGTDFNVRSFSRKT